MTFPRSPRTCWRPASPTAAWSTCLQRRPQRRARRACSTRAKPQPLTARCLLWSRAGLLTVMLACCSRPTLAHVTRKAPLTKALLRRLPSLSLKLRLNLRERLRLPVIDSRTSISITRRRSQTRILQTTALIPPLFNVYRPHLPTETQLVRNEILGVAAFASCLCVCMYLLYIGINERTDNSWLSIIYS